MNPQDPSPEQIAAACLLIQAGWSETERMKRLRVDLRPSFVRCDGEVEEMTAEVYNGHHSERERLQASPPCLGPS